MSKQFIGQLFLLLIALCCQAKPVIYRKGYVKEKGDSTRYYGYVGSTDWKYTPTSVWFSSDSSGEDAMIFYPQDLDEFGMTNGEHYESGYITWNDVAALSPPCKRQNFINQYNFYSKVFLRVLVEGPIVSLFEFESYNHTRFAIRKGTDKGEKSFVTLAGSEGMPDELGNSVYYGVYQQQLIDLIDRSKPGSRQLRIEIGGVGYSASGLLNVVIHLNQNSSCSYVYQEEIHRRDNAFFSIGVSNANFTFDGNNYYLSSLKFKRSTVPYIKLGYEFNNTWKIPSLATRLGISFWGINYRGFGPSEEYSLHQFTIEPSFEILKTIFYVGKTAEIFLGGEGGYNISFYKNNDLVTHQAGYTQQNPDYVGLQPRWFSFKATAGMFLGNRRWDIAVFYQIGETFAWDYGYQFNTRPLGLALTYHLTKRKMESSVN